MKRKSHSALITSWGRVAFFAFLEATVFFGSTVWASPEIDKRYKLETIGVLKSWDNVDGVFAGYVASACNEFFAHQSRFVVNDLSKAELVLVDSKIPYLRIITDTEILGQLSRSTRSESLLRSKIIKEGHQYSVTMDWLHAPKMENLGTVTFQIEDPESGLPFNAGLISKIIQENLAKLISQVPFQAHVTGRDHSSVTLNIGSLAGLRKGDILTIGTIDEVKKHPLLNAIVDWRLTPTGRVEVEQTDEKMAFSKIVEEEPEQKISRYQKVVAIQSAPSLMEGSPSQSARMESRKDDSSPKLGFISTKLGLGTFSRQFSSSRIPISNTGSGFAWGGEAAGEIWLTKTWFTNLEFSYSFLNLNQKNTETGTATPVSQNGGIAGTALLTKFNLGYSYALSEELMGPRIWLKLGYKSHAYNLPSQATPEFTGPINVNSIFVGTGGDLPIRDRWGLTADLNFRLIASASQNWLSDTISSVSDVELGLAGYYRLTPRITARLGLELESNGANFSSGANLSQKTVQFAPSLLYYF